MKTKITSNVLEDISKRLRGDSFTGNKDKALIVFNGSNIELDQKIENIKKLKNNGITVSIAFSFMAERLLDTQKIIHSLSPLNVYREEDIFKLKNISKDYSLIIGPNITMNTLSKVSLGMIDSFIPNLIWTFIYQGKKVYLDFTSVRNYLGEETKNKEILNITEKYIDTIKKMGVIEINGENPFESIIKSHKDSQIDSQTNINKSSQNLDNKKVIIERDIINLTPNNRLTLPKGTIITPLAKDKAKEKNIIIELK